MIQACLRRIPVPLLLLFLLTGCASVPLSKETRQCLSEEVRSRKYFLLIAPKIDEVTVKLTTNSFRIDFKGDLGKRTIWSTATPISADGMLLTAKHSVSAVLEDSHLKPWVIAMQAGHPHAYAATIAWASTNCDLALLKIDDTLPKFYVWSRPQAQLELGQVVVQGGIRSNFAAGKIRAAVMADQVGADSITIEHSARARPGDSGGPLVNQQGQLIGIMTRENLFTYGWDCFWIGGGIAVRPNVDELDRLIAGLRQ